MKKSIEEIINEKINAAALEILNDGEAVCVPVFLHLFLSVLVKRIYESAPDLKEAWLLIEDAIRTNSKAGK